MPSYQHHRNHFRGVSKTKCSGLQKTKEGNFFNLLTFFQVLKKLALSTIHQIMLTERHTVEEKAAVGLNFTAPRPYFSLKKKAIECVSI